MHNVGHHTMEVCLVADIAGFFVHSDQSIGGSIHRILSGSEEEMWWFATCMMLTEQNQMTIRIKTKEGLLVRVPFPS